jgi:glycine/D-amino acid oxidase-like deaminating enzyme
VTGVRTSHGDVTAEVVVNCAGMWARELAAQTGVDVPLQAAEHYYLITDAIEGLDGSLRIRRIIWADKTNHLGKPGCGRSARASRRQIAGLSRVRAWLRRIN